MKNIFILLLIAPCLVFANDNTEVKLNQACERHSASLVARIKNDVIQNVSEKQTQELIAISMESCEAYFKRLFAQQELAQSENSEGEKRNWLTEKILSGDNTRTEGHDRLKRRY